MVLVLGPFQPSCNIRGVKIESFGQPGVQKLICRSKLERH